LSTTGLRSLTQGRIQDLLMGGGVWRIHRSELQRYDRRSKKERCIKAILT